MPESFAPRRAAAFRVLAATGCLVLAACSPGADYPSLFPSVHDIPPPRTDTTLDSNHVQQHHEDLISARDRLSAEAHDAQGKNSSKAAAKSSAESSAKSSAKPTAGPAATSKQPSTPVSARQTVGTGAEQTAGTETK